MNRRPPSFVVTLVALAIVFALAWTFFLRSGPSASAPVVSGIQGTYTWRHRRRRRREDGAFSAVAAGNAGGETRVPEGEPASSRIPPSRPTTRRSARRARCRASARRRRTRAPSAHGRRSGASPPTARWTIRASRPSCARRWRTATTAVGIKPLKEGDRAVWRAAMTMGGRQIDVVVDQQTGIVTWYSDGKDTFTAKVDWDAPPPAGHDLHGRRAGGDEGEDGQGRGLRLRRLAGGGGPHRRLRPARLGPGARRLRRSRPSPPARADLRPLSWISDKVLSLPIGPRGTAVLELYTRGLSQFTVEQVGPATMHFWASVHDWRRSGDAGQAVLPADDAAVRRLQGSDGLDLVPGERAVAVRRRSAPGGLRHRRAHPSGADRVRRGAEARTGEREPVGPEAVSPRRPRTLPCSTPHSGQTQSSGRSSNAVPGSTPLSGSPTSGS